MDLKLHPWNTDFKWEDHTGPFRVVTPAQAEQFDSDGFFVFEDVLTGGDLARTVEEVDRFEAKSEAKLKEAEGGRRGISEAGAITFTTHLVAKSDWLRDLSRSSRIADLCHDIIGPDVRLYWDQAVYKKPEKPRRFPWHQDNGYTFVEPQAYLTVWLALTDATLENGCPQVAKGLHRSGTLKHYFVDPLGFECFENPTDVAAAEVKAGSAVVFSSLSPHLTGPNTTDSVRKAYILQYAPDGAEVQQGTPKDGPPTATARCDAPERQFLVLRNGERVASP